MTDPHVPDDDIPEARLETRGGISLVWLIPLIAALIGGWLVYKTLSEKGPTITIAFKHVEGLEAGKTRIKYKDVIVGKVKEIHLSSDLARVEVIAELSRSMGEHLNENTRFWIVSPRISSSGVSGLSTLISGIYIGMDPGDGRHTRYRFGGLDSPPSIESSAEGHTYVLSAESLGSLDIGSPVYYRQLEVGEVTRYSLDESGHNINIAVFINAPYHALVRGNSRFWNTSGFDLSLSSEGINARLESLTSLIAGGIAFDTPLDLNAGSPGKDGDRFHLYPDIAGIDKLPETYTMYYIMHFDSSLRGLNIGAPVEFRGIKVGEVVDIDMHLDPETLNVSIPVLVSLWPGQISLNDKLKNANSVMDTFISRGLRAQLKLGNLITGQLFIDMEFLDDTPPATIKRSGAYAEFPTVPGTLEKIARNATELLVKIDQMPLLEISNDLHGTLKTVKEMIESPQSRQSMQNLNGTLANLRGISSKLNRGVESVTGQLESSLQQMEETLATVDSVIAEDSPMYYEIRQLIAQFSETAKSFEALTDYLQRNPSALLYGKTGRKR